MSVSATTRTERRVAGPERSRRRLLEGLGFVATWVGLGYLLRVSAETYLLIGIPLTAGFQVLVRRRPLRELWVRGGGARTRPGRRDLAVAAVLALAPVHWGMKAASGAGPAVIGWYLAAVAGAAAAAYALRETTIGALVRSAAAPTAVGVLGNLVVVGGIQVAGGHAVDPVTLVGSTLTWSAVYFPATFVIEEVAFRGALDSHLHHHGESGGRRTALLVSLLWGLWHLPVAGGMPFPLLVLSLAVWHCAIGVPLSFAWRRSGNLAGPALAHAVIDGVRNGVLGL